MIKKHVEIGDNDGSTKHNLLNMLSDAAEIECPYFPFVAKSLGLRHCLEKFKAAMPPIIRVSSFAVQAMPPEDNQESLKQFSKWVQSTIVDSDSNSGSCASPTPKRRRLRSDARSTDNNEDNITGM